MLPSQILKFLSLRQSIMQQKTDIKNSIFKVNTHLTYQGISGIITSSSFNEQRMQTLFPGATTTTKHEYTPEALYPVEHIKTTIQSLEMGSYEKKTAATCVNENRTLHKEWAELAYPILNFATVTFITSGTILIFNSPIRGLLKNYSKDKCFIPENHGGIWAFLKSLYTGTGAAFTGSTARSAYVINAKEGTKAVEEAKEHEKAPGKNNTLSIAYAGKVLSYAFGDILVTQIPESLSGLRKGGQLPEHFSWKKNILPLTTGGFGVRFSSSTASLGALFILEDQIAAQLPIENPCLKHTISGAMSALVSVPLTCPLAMLNQERELRTTVTREGSLANGKTMAVLKDIVEQMKNDPKKGLHIFVQDLTNQLPIRMVNTVIIFAIIAGLGEVLGKEPLTSMAESSASRKLFGFFGCTKKAEEKTTSLTPESPEEEKKSGHKV